MPRPAADGQDATFFLVAKRKPKLANAFTSYMLLCVQGGLL